MRVEQPLGTRGSQKWLQLAIDRAPNVLQELILPSLPGATSVVWRSPLRTDGYAEYRDASFLKLIGQEALSTELGSFWPSKGPQWDALGVSDAGHVLLVEAKAHIPELFSPKTGATNASRARIQAAFGTVAKAEPSPKPTGASVSISMPTEWPTSGFCGTKGLTPSWCCWGS